MKYSHTTSPPRVTSNKHHLIAFGEYVPLRNLMPDFIQKLAFASGDLAPGPGPRTLPWDGAIIGPLICFESIFPGEVRELAASGAEILVNATNDDWFGEAVKPQHLAMSRVRAVENRLPLVRVANTGISAAYDAWGNELAVIDSGVRAGKLVSVAPGPGGSPFRWLGPPWIVLCFLGPFMAFVGCLVRRRTKPFRPGKGF